MCLKQELKLRSKNTNPKIKNLKITIFSNPTISSNPKNPAKSISFKRKPSKPSKPILVKLGCWQILLCFQSENWRRENTFTPRCLGRLQNLVKVVKLTHFHFPALTHTHSSEPKRERERTHRELLPDEGESTESIGPADATRSGHCDYPATNDNHHDQIHRLYLSFSLKLSLTFKCLV